MDVKSIVGVFGEPGTGKSCVRCAEYVVEILKEGASMHISNFPIILDGPGGMVAAVAKACKISEEQARRKIFILPPEEFDSWTKCGVEETGRGKAARGPWDYFKEIGLDLSGAHIAMDEFQEVCPPSGTSAKHIQNWREWLSLIRHDGATFEFISQHEVNVHQSIVKLAGTHRQFTQSEDEKPLYPILPGRMYEYRQFQNKFSGKQYKIFWEAELGQKEGKFQVVNRRSHLVKPHLFTRYDSHSKRKGGTSGAERKQPWQRYSWPMLFLWAFVQHPIAYIWRLAIVAFFVAWACNPSMVHVLTKYAADLYFNQAKSVAVGTAGDQREPQEPTAKAVIVNPLEMKPTKLEVKKLTSNEEPVEPTRDVVLMLEPQGVFFELVGYINQGEEITEGPHNGQRVEEIDFFRGRVVLSDDTVFRMYSSKRRAPGSGSVSPDIRTGDAGGTANAPDPRRAVASRNNELRGDAGEGAGAPLGKAASDNVHLGRTVRAEIDNARSQGRATRSLPATRRPTNANGAVPSSQSFLPRDASPGGSSDFSPEGFSDHGGRD